MPRRLLAIVLCLAACGPLGPSPMVDGWPVGNEYVCSDPACAPYIQLAIDGLGRRDPGHAEIIGATLHELGALIGDDGRLEVPRNLGRGPFLIVVFRLADGSQRAIGVTYVGVSREPSAHAWGPGLDDQPPNGR